MRLSGSLKVRLLGLMSLLMVTIVVVIVATLWVINGQKSDGVVINLAGRQRMLSQKFSKELLIEIQSQTGPDSGRTAESKAAEPAYAKTKALFEVTLAALTAGGQTFLDLGMTKPVEIPPTADPAILSKLTEVSAAWNALQETTSIITKEPAGSPALADALADFKKLNVTTLKQMNAAVGMYQNASEGKVALLKKVQLTAAGVSIAFFGFAIWMLTTHVVRPLNRIVKRLDDSASSVATSSEEVGSASESLAQGAVAQADSIEQTTATVQGLARMAESNADNSGKANQCASKAKNAASQGGQAMSNLQSAMAAIDKSTTQVGKVLQTIEDIAFQTNLLALNAAIEAEGAGEHGKRFAVVAEEVRKLAGRCTEAAQDTAALIEQSAENAKLGVKHCEETAVVFTGIQSSIDEASEWVGQIAQASQEQAKGANQVSQAIGQIENITQSNAAASEESSGAALELRHQAEQTQQVVLELSAIINGNANRSGQ